MGTQMEAKLFNVSFFFFWLAGEIKAMTLRVLDKKSTLSYVLSSLSFFC
jgi:hypothetical protein